MDLFKWLGNLFGGNKAQPKPQPNPQQKAPGLGTFLAQQLGNGVQNYGRNLKKGFSDIGNTHLQGVEQLLGRNDVTLGKLANKTPVLGPALKFGQQDNSKTSVGQFAKGFTGAGIQGAGYVVPEAKVIKVPGMAARFVNQALPAAGLSVAGDLVQGNRNPASIAQNAAINGGLAGGANALMGLRRGDFRLPGPNPIKVHLPELPTSVPSPVSAGARIGKLKAMIASEPDPNVKMELAGQLPDLGRAYAREQGSKALPKYQLKKENWLAKATLPTVDIIKRQGKAGQELGQLVDNVVTKQELHQAELTGKMPSVLKGLNRKEKANFGDVVEGKATPVSPKQAKAVQEWRTVSPTIRTRALKAGLEVGNRGPNYFPHLVNFDKLGKRNNFNVAVNHLVDTKQAKTHEEAVGLLNHARDIARNRPNGNLEASRMVDIPFYDKSPQAIGRYIHGATQRIAHVETFGKKDSKALRLLTKIAREGHDSEAAKNAFDVAVGAKQYGPTAAKASAIARKFNTATKLGTAQISNAGQSVNTATVAGYHRVLKGAIDAMGKEGKDFVQKSGVVADAVLNDLAHQQGVDSWVGKIGAPGFGSVEKANRTIAALAGRHWANDLAKKGGAKELKILTEKLGVKGPIGKELTQDQQIQAARQLVELSQFKTGAKDLPGWADSPAGKLVAQFRTFPYKQGNFLLKEVLKPASQGNIAPLARFLAALPIGYGIYEAKNILRNRPDDPTIARKTFESFQALGGAGVAGSVVQGLMPRFGKYLPPGVYASQVAGTLGGPTVSTLGRAADAIGSAATGSWTPAGRVALGTIPVIGGTLQNTLLPYAGVGNRTAGATASSSSSTGASPAPAATSGGGSILTGDNTTQAYKDNQKQIAAQKKTDVASGKRLGGTAELDAAQQRIDTAQKKFPTGLSQSSKDVLTHYAKLNDSGKAAFDADPRNGYLLAQAKLEQDKKAGKLTTLEEFSRSQKLGKLEVTSRYSTEAQTLYSMSKAVRGAFLNAYPDFQKYLPEAAKMDTELAGKGWIAKSKFSTGGSGGTASKAYSKKLAKLNLQKVRLTNGSFKSFKVKRVKVKA